MEPQVALTQNGQGVQDDEFNLMAEESALSMDWLLCELLRCAPSGAADSFAPAKYIVPAGGSTIGYGQQATKSLIYSSGSANAKVRIQPFLAIVSSRSNPATDPEALREIRSVRHFGTSNPAGFYTDIEFPAPASNNRWDLVYAKVDVEVPDSNVDRYVKVGDGAVTTASVQLIKRTTITILRLGGTEAGTPTRPTLPSDSGNSYYIPLAYVFIASSHTLSTQVSGVNIYEVYPPIQLAAPYGVLRSRPADGCWRTDGSTVVNAGWTSANGRPPTYQPPGMQGGDEIRVPIAMADATGAVNVPPNVATILDRSVDWTKREFELLFDVKTPASGHTFPWLSVGQGSTRVWTFTSVPTLGIAQSYLNDNASLNTFTGGAVTTGFILFTLTDSTTPALATGAKFVLYVGNDGLLYAWRNNVDAVRHALIRIRATARFANIDANGS